MFRGTVISNRECASELDCTTLSSNNFGIMKIFRGLIAWLSIITMGLIMTNAVFVYVWVFRIYYEGTTEISCVYKLEKDEKFQFLKWYKDQKEFYVYDPNDSPNAMSLRLPGVKVDMSRSGVIPENGRHIICLLERDYNTDGWYTCEVSVKRNGVPRSENTSEKIELNATKYESRRYSSNHQYMRFDYCKLPPIDATTHSPDESTSVFSETPEAPTIVIGVAGSPVNLPCNITPPGEEDAEDAIDLVVWFKDESTTPIYVLDARQGSLHQAKHAAKDSLNARAHLSIAERPAFLKLDPVMLEDKGEYKCRVDFKKAKTRYMSVLLKVAEWDPKTNMTTTADDGLPDLCKNATIDAIFTTKDKSTYVFQGRYYWKLAVDGLEEGYPRKIADDWDGLPGNIDAAYTYISCWTYFFKGSIYWRYTNQILNEGYPMNISDEYHRVVADNVDAAFTWGKHRYVYFLKGDSYYRYDENNYAGNVEGIYPRKINDTSYGWEGVPNNIDAILSRKKMTYFFKGNYYYKFDHEKEEVLEDPQSTAVYIFGCLGKEITPKL